MNRFLIAYLSIALVFQIFALAFMVGAMEMRAGSYCAFPSKQLERLTLSAPYMCKE